MSEPEPIYTLHHEKIIEFDVMGTPTGKGRPRATIRGRHAAVYTDAKTVAAENSFLAQALPHRPAQPLTGAIRMTLNIYVAIPKSYSKGRRVSALQNLIRPLAKPDIDNIAKLAAYSLNGVFYADDQQIVEIDVRKYYGITPRTCVRIEEL